MMIEEEEDDYCEPDFDEAYYLLDDNRVGRVWYDTETDEYFDAEVLGEDGQWQPWPPEEIEARGREVSFDEAEPRVRELGGTV